MVVRNQWYRPIHLLLKNVLHVPDLGYNLLSTSALCKDGYGVMHPPEQQGNSYISLHRRQKIPLTLTEGGLYTVKMLPYAEEYLQYSLFSHHSLHTPAATDYVRTTEDYACLAMNRETQCRQARGQHWHRVLGHRNFHDIKRLVATGQIPKLIDLNWTCDECAQSKLTNHTFPNYRDNLSTVPFEIMHVDLFGPQSIPSMSGGGHAMIYSCEATGFGIPFFLNRKSEVPEKMVQMLDEVSRLSRGQQTKRQVWHIHSDNAKEFLSKEVMNIAAARGIYVTTSSNCSPPQNGRAERRWRTINEMAAILLKEAKARNNELDEEEEKIVVLFSHYLMIPGRRPR